MRIAPDVTEKRQVVVAFWRRTETEKIEFYIPLNFGYMEVMSHLAACQPAEAARSWIERQFDINPRSPAQVFRTIAGSVVAFALNNTEFRIVSDRMPGAWLSSQNLSYPTKSLLGHVERRLV